MQSINLEGGTLPTTVAISGQLDPAGVPVVKMAVTFGGITRSIIMPLALARTLANALHKETTAAELSRAARADLAGLG